MAVIFSSEPGVAVAINDPSVLPITFNFQGWGGYFYRRAVLQGISIESRGNYQFMNTLRNYIYVYVFGEKMGAIRITGLTFMSDCAYGGVSGISGVLDYYAKHAISAIGIPIGIQIGMAGFYGFLVGVRLDAVNPETRVGQFSLTFQTVPT